MYGSVLLWWCCCLCSVVRAAAEAGVDVRMKAESVETQIISCRGSSVAKPFEKENQLYAIQLNGSLPDGVLQENDNRKMLSYISGQNINYTAFFDLNNITYTGRALLNGSDPAGSYLQLFVLDRPRCPRRHDERGQYYLDSVSKECFFSGNFKTKSEPAHVADKNYTKVTCCAGDGCAEVHGLKGHANDIGRATDFARITIERRSVDQDQDLDLPVCEMRGSSALQVDPNGSTVFEGRVNASGVWAACWVPTLNNCGEQFVCKVRTWTEDRPLVKRLNHTFDEARYCRPKPTSPPGPSAQGRGRGSVVPVVSVSVAVAVAVVAAVVVVVAVYLCRRSRRRAASDARGLEESGQPLGQAGGPDDHGDDDNDV